jgi:uncharacterized protein
MNKGVALIAGGTGFIGQALASSLRSSGFKSLRILSRNPRNADEYRWNVEEGTIDPRALEGDVTHVVFTAGDNIASSRITPERLAVLRDSRIKATRLLVERLQSNDRRLTAYVSCSAIGFYGCSTRPDAVYEDDRPGTDWSAKMCEDWEAEIGKASAIADRVVTLRLPPVLGRDHGAYPKMALPARWGLASAFASGEQPFPWIHVEDCVAIFQEAVVSPSWKGVYNVVAPEHVSHAQFTAALAHSFGMPYWLPNIPQFVLNAGMGRELGDLLCGGVDVRTKRLGNFAFKYPSLARALAELSK